MDAKTWEVVLDTIPEAISVHSTDGRILHANNLIANIYGQRPSQLVGLSCEDVFHKSEFVCPHQEVMQSRQASQFESKSSLDERSFSITVAPMLDEEGQPTGFVRIMRDITDRIRTQEQLLKTERFATLGQMISGIAHDVGTPLSIISGYSEYLLMRTEADAPGHKELSTILQQTRRIAEFIKQMLDLSRPAQGRADAIGLKGFLAESLDLMGHHFRKADVKAALDCKISSPLVYGDAPRLRQAFLNLFLIAAQQIGPGSRLEIIVDESLDGSGSPIVVMAGINSAGEGYDFRQPFSEFLDPSQTDQIAGMGLSLTREIIDEFGARVEIVEMENLGRPIVLYLPKNDSVTVATRV